MVGGEGVKEFKYEKVHRLWDEFVETLFELHLICAGTKEDFPRALKATVENKMEGTLSDDAFTEVTA